MVSTMKKLQVKKDELLICDRTYAEVKASFATRYKHWCREVKTKGKQAALDFNLRLSRKQHAGTLNFNHDEETLKLDVARNSQDTQASPKPTPNPKPTPTPTPNPNPNPNSSPNANPYPTPNRTLT